jgi:DNA repair protein RadD
MILRDYQTDVVAEYDRLIAAGVRRIIIVAPTGSGKTMIAAEIIKRARSQRVVFIAHRNELLTQARDKLRSFDIGGGIIKAGRDKDQRPQALVQVCGIQTLHARAVRAKSMELPPAQILIIDEAHHVRAMTYQTIISAYPDAIIIGLTATPCRADGRGLGNVFEAMIECPQIPELIEQGHLVKLKIFAPPPPDLRGVQVMSTGDYNLDQLGDKMDPLVGDFVEHWLKHAQHRRTIAFAVDVRHSIHITDELIKAGIRAEHVDGATPQADRDAIIARLASGETEVVSNVGIFTEGFDSPDVGCIALVRPTRSLGLFRQMIGRGLRPAEGKSDVIILDHSGGVHRHGRPDDVIQWELDTDKRATNKTQQARIATVGHDPFVECKGCGALRMRGAACNACGWEPKPPPRAVEYVDGELVELGKQNTAAPTRADKFVFYAELRGFQRTARKKDGSPYSNGWAAQQFKTKHGHFPPWDWNNQPTSNPSLATLRWIKSRQIAFAKRRAAG